METPRRSFMLLAAALVSASTVFAQTPPTVSKSFSPATIAVGNSTNLAISLRNPGTTTLTGVNVTDTLPVGLQFDITGTYACFNGTLQVTTTTATFTGVTMTPNSSCGISTPVTGTTADLYVNTTSAPTSNESGPGVPATASLTVGGAPPTLTKSFGDSQVQLLGPNTTTLSFTITNPNTTAVSGVAFSDTLPAGLAVSTPNGLVGTCGGGLISAFAGANTIGLAGATLAGNASCTFSVDVTGVAIGQQTNTTTAITAAGGLVGQAATATTDVNALFFLWFFAESGGGGR